MSLKCWKQFRDLDDVFAKNIKIALTVDFNDQVGEQLAAVMVLHNDDVYSIGKNNYGCLGVKGIKSSAIPVKVSALCQKGVQKLAAGYGHVVALTKDGQLFAWGDNKFAQLGQAVVSKGNQYNVTDERVFVPTPINAGLEGKQVVDVACGFNHTLALTSEGHVYGWGSNERGRVGVGSIGYVIGTPAKIIFPQFDKTQIKAVGCGRHFSVALSQAGKIFLWGSNEYRQLGITEGTVSTVPKELKLNRVFTSIACGAWHTVALTDKNEVIRWGYDGNQKTPPEEIAKDLCPVLEVAATFHLPISVLRNNTGIYIQGQCLGQTFSSPQLTQFQSTDEAFAYCGHYSVMWRQMSFEKVVPTIIDAWLAAFKNQGYNCDIEFHVDEKVIRAHKLYLQTRSEYFRQFFAGPWGESCDGVIRVDGFDYDTFYAFLRYLYSDWIEPGPVTEMFELLKIADYYGEADLHGRCEKMLKASISVQNVCWIYCHRRECDAKGLEDYALKFMKENYAKVLRTSDFQLLDSETQKLIIESIVP